MSIMRNEADAPAVSIITPAYNAARYIAQTLESVIAQTFADFEAVLVDDGSTDDTAAIVETFAARDSRIRLIRQRNRGIGGARNTAVAHARGRMIALLDSDDLWMPSYLGDQLALLYQNPHLDVLSANALNMGGPLDGTPLRPVSGPPIAEITLLDLIRTEDAVCILSVFRREVWDKVGGFDAELRGSEDYDFWLRALAAGFRIAFNPTPLGQYRRRPDSVSADEILMLKAIAIPLGKIRAVCGDQPEVRAAVDQQLARFNRRLLLVSAKHALQRADRRELQTQFQTLHVMTGSTLFRVAGWVGAHAPIAILLLYRCKQFWTHLLPGR